MNKSDEQLRAELRKIVEEDSKRDLIFNGRFTHLEITPTQLSGKPQLIQPPPFKVITEVGRAELIVLLIVLGAFLLITVITLMDHFYRGNMIAFSFFWTLLLAGAWVSWRKSKKAKFTLSSEGIKFENDPYEPWERILDTYIKKIGRASCR